MTVLSEAEIEAIRQRLIPRWPAQEDWPDIMFLVKMKADCWAMLFAIDDLWRQVEAKDAALEEWILHYKHPWVSTADKAIALTKAAGIEWAEKEEVSDGSKPVL